MPDMLGLPTVPEYYKDHIDPKVNLMDEPKQCCPFHHEDRPSFSFDIKTGKWRCFGKCHTGGGVVELHKMKYNIATREEAKESLYRLYGIKVTEIVKELKETKPYIDEAKISNEAIFQQLLIKANRPDRWLDLDYVMSKTPIDYLELLELLIDWKEQDGEEV